MDRILTIATRVATPLALGGLVVALFFFIVRQIISAGLIPQVTQQTGGALLMRIINVFFVLALVAIVLGAVGYIVKLVWKGPTVHPGFVSIGTPPNQTLAQIVHAVATARNVTINFNAACGPSIRNAIIEGQKHEADSIELLLENLKDRVTGNSIDYSVKKQGARRYEIICE